LKFRQFITEEKNFVKVRKIEYNRAYILQDKKTKKYVAKGFVNWRRKEGRENPTIPKLTNSSKEARRFLGSDLKHYKIPENFDILEDIGERNIVRQWNKNLTQSSS
jgi:hypothetical protein